MIRTLIRLWFRCTSRARASKRIRAELTRYLALAEALGPEKAATPARVPSLPGVDEDMRDWSLFQILEHNVIVNRAIGRFVASLARDEAPLQTSDPKKDVMPSQSPGPEQVEAFRQSVDAYLETVSALPRLRGTRVHPHPVFGPLSAHGWHCMCGFHLEVHRRQAQKIAAMLQEQP